MLCGSGEQFLVFRHRATASSPYLRKRMLPTDRGRNGSRLPGREGNKKAVRESEARAGTTPASMPAPVTTQHCVQPTEKSK